MRPVNRNPARTAQPCARLREGWEVESYEHGLRLQVAAEVRVHAPAHPTRARHQLLRVVTARNVDVPACMTVAQGNSAFAVTAPDSAPTEPTTCVRPIAPTHPTTL